MEKPVDTEISADSVIQLGRLEIRVREEVKARAALTFLIGEDLEFLVNGEPIDLGGLHCKAIIEVAPGKAVKVVYEAVPAPW